MEELEEVRGFVGRFNEDTEVGNWQEEENRKAVLQMKRLCQEGYQEGGVGGQ